MADPAQESTAQQPQPGALTPATGGEAPLLEARKLTKTFGGLRAVEGINFSIKRGNIVSVIGPNGAGKTTFFNLITGIYRPDPGSQIIFNGKNIADESGTSLTFGGGAFGLLARRLGGKNPVQTPDRILDLGIARTFQNIRLFNNMTVLENVLVGQHARLRSGVWGALFRPPGTRREEKLAVEKAMSLLEFFGPELVQRKDDMVSGLAYAYRRQVEIARALASDPILLLLDEPTAGMNSSETREATAYINRLRVERGLTILVIEHKLQVVMGISDHIIVLDYGKKIAEGLPEEIRHNEQVIEAYLGRKATA